MLVGPKSVAVPGSLKAWCEALERFGTMSLADVMQPAIRHAARGFAVTPYLARTACRGCRRRPRLKDKPAAALLLPGGTPLKAGERLVQGAICRH
jgi:gamma-glutamyltranspeptidase/glutathione hydrolase